MSPRATGWSTDAPTSGHRAPEPRSGHGRRPAQSGQASVELLAALPVVLLVAVAIAQVMALGYASVLAGNAAEAGALALAGGGDARAAARAALPGWSRARGEVAVKGGEVVVRLRPPALLDVLARRLEVSAAAGVEAP
jgi:hypothetical protein